MWFYDTTVYQIYPLGLCGAPAQNDGQTVPRIRRLESWAQHIAALGCGAVLLNPVFQSDAHGYDTRDYTTLDCRLGTNEDLAAVCKAFHEAGLRVLLDGVFNHVGRGFWAFEDVRRNREASPYKDWFHIDFGGNTDKNDGFWYEGWEGHNDLVKLNLRNPAVVEHIFSAIRGWVEQFGIDGLRLDVAYCLDLDFLRQLRRFTDTLKPEFALLGEVVHGDYNRWMNDEMCHSVTNYECYKGLYSSFNSMNMFEIGHSLARQFGPEPWTLYKGRHPYSFVDNHDVTRIASIQTNPAHLPLVYGVMFGMPGVPSIYYGSEWGMQGNKTPGTDAPLRPEVETPQQGALYEAIAAMAKARASSEALRYGSYRNVVLTNKQIIFERRTDAERVLVAVNADAEPWTAHFDAGCGQAQELLTDTLHDFGGGSTLPPYSVQFWKMER